MKRTMTMEQRKAAGIKAAREKAEIDRKLGGRAPVRAKKAEGEANGVKSGKEAGGTKDGKEMGGAKEAKEVNGPKGGKEVNGEAT